MPAATEAPTTTETRTEPPGDIGVARFALPLLLEVKHVLEGFYQHAEPPEDGADVEAVASLLAHVKGKLDTLYIFLREHESRTLGGLKSETGVDWYLHRISGLALAAEAVAHDPGREFPPYGHVTFAAVDSIFDFAREGVSWCRSVLAAERQEVSDA